jgi:hypothetical protein
MPFFKSTYNILKKPDEDEVFNPNWMDSDKLVLPPSTPWDYNRDMIIDDVDIWEVLYEATSGIGVYVSWQPYAEFYLITTGIDTKIPPNMINGSPYFDRTFETYYGPTAEKQVYQRAKELGINLNLYKVWVEPEDMWLYQNPEPSNKIFIPNLYQK